MEKILRVGLGGFPKQADVVLKELREVLEPAFLIRVAAEDLGIDHNEFPSHSSHCFFEKKRGIFGFRLDEYIRAVFQRGTEQSWRPRLKTMLEDLAKQLKDDPRSQIHGHDFREAFAWYIRRHNGYGHLHPETISTVLLGFIDFGALKSQALFAQLLQRLTLSEWNTVRDIEGSP